MSTRQQSPVTSTKDTLRVVHHDEPTPHLSWRERCLDLWDDTRIGIGRSLGRTVLMVSMSALAVGFFTWTHMSSAVGSQRVNAVFDGYSSTHLSVQLPVPDSENRVANSHLLNAITNLPHAKRAAAVAIEEQESVIPPLGVGEPTVFEAKVINIYGDAEALGLETSDGTSATTLATQVGAAFRRVGPLNIGKTIIVDHKPVTVGSIVTSAKGIPAGEQYIYRPTTKPIALASEGQIVVEVDPGTAEKTSNRIKTMLHPENPALVRVAYVQDAKVLRKNVSDEVNGALKLVAIATAVSGFLAIVLATVLKMLQLRRVNGLYRALGASRTSLLTSGMVEAATTGALGAIFGASCALAAAAAWYPEVTAAVVPWGWVVLAPALAGVATAVATLVPMLIMTAKPPVDEIRST